MIAIIISYFWKYWKYSIIFVQWFHTSSIFVQWFCTSSIFKLIFVNSSFAFTSAFVFQNVREHKSTEFIPGWIWIWEISCFLFCETRKFRNKILSHCLSRKYRRPILTAIFWVLYMLFEWDWSTSLTLCWTVSFLGLY